MFHAGDFKKMYSIYYSLRNYAGICPVRKTTVFLHTSCVLDHSLERLFSSDELLKQYDLYVTDDCYYELVALSRYSVVDSIKEAAELIIQYCKRAENINMRELYGYNRTAERTNLSVKLNLYEKNQYIFVFYDGGAAEEFVLNVVDSVGRGGVFREAVSGRDNTLDFCRILYFDKNYFKEHSLSNMIFAPVRLTAFAEAGQYLRVFRKEPQRVQSTERTPVMYLDGDIYIRYPGAGEERISGSDLEWVSFGGNADIFRFRKDCYHDPYAIKVISTTGIDEARRQSLLYLSRYSGLLTNITLPLALVYDDSDRCIGYLMRYLEGGGTIFSEQENLTAERTKRIAGQLSALLLELRLFQLEMNDISLGNFYVSGGKLYMLDSDSLDSRRFQLDAELHTPRFAHKDVGLAKTGFFRDRRCNDFSYAVLLFEMYIKITPLRIRREQIDDWNMMFEHGFVHYTPDGAPGACTRAAKAWMNHLSRAQRCMFCDEFSFVSNYSIGQWVKGLELCS